MTLNDYNAPYYFFYSSLCRSK